MDETVRAQYEAYPYPPRDPAEEATRLVTGSPSHVLEIDHYVFAGRRDFARPFRALFAGGGTGDGTVMLAQQLADRGTPAEIVHLDLSAAAQAIAAARIARRGLAVRFVQGSLLALDRLGLGGFDYIDCCGVLHHLDDPLAGFRALERALAPDGGMGVMVYAPLGRTGVYPLQALLRALAGEAPLADRLALARRLLPQLPATNWFKRNPHLHDHLSLGDAGLFDLLLHSRDRAFSIAELARLVADAGLRIAGLCNAIRYEPAAYLDDRTLLARLDGLVPLDRAAFAELLAGNIKTHTFYVVKAANPADTVARPDGTDAIPVLRDGDGPALALRARTNRIVHIGYDGLDLRLPLPALAPEILARIDGTRTLGAIHRALAEAVRPAPEWAAFKAEFDRLYLTLHGLGCLFIRHAA
ncbi:MAG: methyltransferase [Alphaproteobacteria bacterium]|nr:methyltransferase [Alphaproteobacteria bacterium]